MTKENNNNHSNLTAYVVPKDAVDRLYGSYDTKRQENFNEGIYPFLNKVLSNPEKAKELKIPKDLQQYRIEVTKNTNPNIKTPYKIELTDSQNNKINIYAPKDIDKGKNNVPERKDLTSSLFGYRPKPALIFEPQLYEETNTPIPKSMVLAAEIIKKSDIGHAGISGINKEHEDSLREVRDYVDINKNIIDKNVVDKNRDEQHPILGWAFDPGDHTKPSIPILNNKIHISDLINKKSKSNQISGALKKGATKVKSKLSAAVSKVKNIKQLFAKNKTTTSTQQPPKLTIAQNKKSENQGRKF